VSYPPFTPFVEHIGLGIFGLSLVGLRLFSVIAQSAAIVVTGLMARELDGARLAQVAAALTIALSPLLLFEGTESQYTTFDYLIPLALFFFAKGRDYYLAGAYPMLLAMGATAGERWLASLSKFGRRTIEAVFFSGLAVCGAYIFARVLPLASSGPLRDFALKNNSDLREEVGWDELVRTVACIRDSRPPDQQSNLGITVRNYGEQGAIEILGPAYHLPPPISTTNSAWLRGYATQPPTTIIALGITLEQADSIFTNRRLVGHNGNSEGIRNKASQYHPNIFVCGPSRLPWPPL